MRAAVALSLLPAAALSTEVELEAKVNLERRFGPLTLLANLWGEREWYYRGVSEWVLNPTGGVSWQLSPAIHLGLEYWMRWEFGGPANIVQPPHGWNIAGQIGDQYGRLWIRTIVGVEL